jgi:hypothetical protein
MTVTNPGGPVAADVLPLVLVHAEDPVHAGAFENRHVDSAVDSAVRGVADNDSAVDQCLPEIAFGIHGRSVGGSASGGVDTGEDAAVGSVAGFRVVVVTPDVAGPCVAEVEDLPVGAEAGTVRTDDALIEDAKTAVGRIGVETPQRVVFHHVHGSDDETSLPVGFAVVEPCPVISFRIGDECLVAGCLVNPVETGFERGQKC